MNFTTEELQAEMDAIRNNKSERMSEKELNQKTIFEKDDDDNGTIWTVLIYLLAFLSAVTASFFITHLFNLFNLCIFLKILNLNKLLIRLICSHSRKYST